MTVLPIPLNFLVYEENFVFFFYQCREEPVPFGSTQKQPTYYSEIQNQTL